MLKEIAELGVEWTELSPSATKEGILSSKAYLESKLA